MLVRFLLAGLVALSPQSLRAAEYPNHPIRIIVPFSAGSATDIIARLVGPKMSESWGQQVVVDNRPSAGGTVAGGIVATSTPDGHTIMFTSSGFAGSAALYEKLPYDSVKDFAGVTLLAVTPLVVIVSPTLGVKSVKELIALAKQKPAQITYASSGIGSGTHFAGELFKLAAGIDVIHVPYRGTPEATNDTMSGRINFFVSPVLPIIPLIKAGRVVPLGVTFLQRLPILPDVPTLSEAGLPNFEYEGWYGVFVPARTPRTVITKLSKEVGRALMLPDVYDKIAATGATPKPSTPEAFDRKVREEIAVRRKIFKASGAKAE